LIGGKMLKVKALLFDVFGTVVDWINHNKQIIENFEKELK